MARANLIITGVIDGPLTGGVPKAIELFACTDIADLSVYGVESANNGNDAGGSETTLPDIALPAGSYFYLASEIPQFSVFFGFAPNATAGALSINGDDAMLLYLDGVGVVDVFGVVGVDGTGEDWEYTDSWAYRISESGPSTAFSLADWNIPGRDELDGETAVGDTAFPLKSYQCGDGGPSTSPPTLAPSVPPPPTPAPTVPEVAIYDIQGNGPDSPFDDTVVITEGIVTGVFSGSASLQGFFMQDATGDGDASTSDAIFVFTGSLDTGLSVGDCLRVTGEVSERFGSTQMSGFNRESCVSPGPITPVALAADVFNANPEAYEHMLVTFTEDLTVVEVFQLARFGEIRLSSSGAFYQPTNLFLPGSPEAVALAASIEAHTVVLDDDNNRQNRYPNPYVAPGEPRRLGDVVEGLTGVVDFAFGVYKIRPTSTVEFVDSPREPAPEDVGGVLKIGAFNVLNYFNGDGLGGGFPTPRGADTPEEFDRQKSKIVQAIVEIDADVLGLIEIENDGYGPESAIQDLVDGVNGVLGSNVYTFVNPFPDAPETELGTDAIVVGFIYKAAAVKVVGDIAVMDSSVNPDFISTKNRPCLIATFESGGGFECSTVSVCHFKSKGSSCNDVGDPEDPDGQGNCNGVRTWAAGALAQYLDTNPTMATCPNALIVGDLNAYAREDPIELLKNEYGYTDLLNEFVGDAAYSYVFNGQLGYLDHALARGSAVDIISGATEWHINSLEANILDYNTEFGKPVDFFSPDVYRSSDHDPLLVGVKACSNLSCRTRCGKNDSKVEICHKGKNTLCISESALASHCFNHGDTCGACE